MSIPFTETGLRAGKLRESAARDAEHVDENEASRKIRFLSSPEFEVIEKKRRKAA